MRLRTRKRRHVEGVSKHHGARHRISARRGGLICALVAAAVLVLGSTSPQSLRSIVQMRLLAPSISDPTETGPPAPVWVASAPGRIEPLSGEVRIDTVVVGRVAEVVVKTNDRVSKGDLLVRLEDDELVARLASAEAQALQRKRERDSAPVTGSVARRRTAEDKAAAAERAVVTARRAQDRLSAGGAAEALLAQARKAVTEAQERLQDARDEFARTKAKIDSAPGPLDTALAIARAELSAAEALLEKTRVRAPFAGTILQLPVRVGEVASPSRERPVVVLGDVSRLRVRVDLDERYREKVFVGQPVLIRWESSVNSFKGKVTEIAPALVLAQATSRSRRRHPERSVVEVLVELAGPTRLMSGMQVDVFFLASPSGS